MIKKMIFHISWCLTVLLLFVMISFSDTEKEINDFFLSWTAYDREMANEFIKNRNQEEIYQYLVPRILTAKKFSNVMNLFGLMGVLAIEADVPVKYIAENAFISLYKKPSLLNNFTETDKMFALDYITFIFGEIHDATVTELLVKGTSEEYWQKEALPQQGVNWTVKWSPDSINYLIISPLLMTYYLRDEYDFAKKRIEEIEAMTITSTINFLLVHWLHYIESHENWWPSSIPLFSLPFEKNKNK